MSTEQQIAGSRAAYADSKRREAYLARADHWRTLLPIHKQILEGRAEEALQDWPTLRHAYTMWQHYNKQLGPLRGSRKTQLRNIYRQRKRILDALPKRDRDLPLDELRMLYPMHAQQLDELRQQREALRVLVSTLAPWQTSDDLPLLRKWRKKLEKQVQDAGQLDEPAELTAVKDKIHRIELEEYDFRLRLWRGLHPAQRNPREIPRRPRWLREQEELEAIQAKRQAQIDKWVPLQPPVGGALVDERLVIRAARRAARLRARKVNHLDGLVSKLLDWVWGEARCYGLALDVDGWLYVDDTAGATPQGTRGGVPHVDKRGHILAACGAVRLSTGWAFPPATGRGLGVS